MFTKTTHIHAAVFRGLKLTIENTEAHLQLQQRGRGVAHGPQQEIPRLGRLDGPHRGRRPVVHQHVQDLRQLLRFLDADVPHCQDVLCTLKTTCHFVCTLKSYLTNAGGMRHPPASAASATALCDFSTPMSRIANASSAYQASTCELPLGPPSMYVHVQALQQLGGNVPHCQDASSV